MLHPDFNVAEALASVVCPRCGHIGMRQLGVDVLIRPRPENVHHSIGSMDPAVGVGCPSCSLVAEWPAVSLPDPPGQESQNRPGNFREGDTLDPGTPPPAFPPAGAKPSR